MNRTPMRRLLMAVVSTVAAAATITAASPAVAADMFFAKTSGRYATVQWLEMGEMPAASGVPGNAHIGQLWVEDLGNGRASAFGVVHDLQCPAGATPSLPGGGHGEEPPVPGPDECAPVMQRFMEGVDLTFVMDRKLSSATLTGALLVGGGGHGDPTVPTGQPPVRITWVGTGVTTTSRQTFTFTDEYGTHSSRYSSTDRPARIAAGSLIGPMIFDDEAGEWSEAGLGTFRSLDRSRS